MARIRGSISFSSNYESSISKPMDSRMLVPSYDDLLDNSNWLTSKGTPCCFNGMLVAVANTTDTTKNGLYMLLDGTNSRKPNVTIETNWIKIGETSDIGDLVDRVSSIEESLTEITNDIADLDARVKALEEDSDVEVFGYRSGFPAQGVANKLYVAADEEKSYVWVNNDYLPIGGDSAQPEIIFGGTAD